MVLRNSLYSVAPWNETMSTCKHAYSNSLYLRPSGPWGAGWGWGLLPLLAHGMCIICPFLSCLPCPVIILNMLSAPSQFKRIVLMRALLGPGNSNIHFLFCDLLFASAEKMHFGDLLLLLEPLILVISYNCFQNQCLVESQASWGGLDSTLSTSRACGFNGPDQILRECIQALVYLGGSEAGGFPWCRVVDKLHLKS